MKNWLPKKIWIFKACIDTLVVLSFRYNGHYFVTTLIYSVLLGFLGMDRFCLGHTGTAVGKLLTLGGVGIWWIVDIVLLVNGMLTPDDGSNWVPYYWSRDLRKLLLKHLSVLICWKRAFFSTIFVKTTNIQMAIMIQLYVINVGRKMWNWPRNENDHVGPSPHHQLKTERGL